MRQLDRDERTVLMRASAIGRRFPLAVLTATTALAEERVRAALDKACALQLVVREGAGAEWYAFRHALIRDVAHQNLVESRLRPIHRLIARALERCAGADESGSDDLAYHSWAAGDSVRCVLYNELAGDRAVAAFAACEARIYYERARDFAAPDSEQFARLTGKLFALPQEGG